MTIHNFNMCFPELEDKMTDKGRFYKTPSGVWYPSVTTVISSKLEKGLEKWKDLVGEEEAERLKNAGALRGTALHNNVEKWFEGTLDETKVHHAELVYFRPIKKKLEQHLNSVLAVESALYSDVMQTAGRMDLFGIYGRKLSLIDFKTARKPKLKEHLEKYKMQLSVYARMIQERLGIYPEQAVLLIATSGVSGAQTIILNKSEYLTYLKQFMTIRQGF